MTETSNGSDFLTFLVVLGISVVVIGLGALVARVIDHLNGKSDVRMRERWDRAQRSQRIAWLEEQLGLTETPTDDVVEDPDSPILRFLEDIKDAVEDLAYQVAEIRHDLATTKMRIDQHTRSLGDVPDHDTDPRLLGH